MRFFSALDATRLFSIAAALGALSIAAAVHAQELPAGVTLGITANELQHALPEVEKVRRPQRMAGGLVGAWRLPSVQVLGLAGERTFFFAGTHLSRVEFVGSTPSAADDAQACNDLVSWGRTLYGPEIAAADANANYATWELGDTVVYVQCTRSPPAIRLIQKLIQARDASAL